MGPYAEYIIQTIVTLFGVCVLAVFVLYAARRMGAGRSRGPIELVGLLPLETRRSIYLVKVGEQVLVVGVSEAGFAKLGEVPASSISAEQGAAGPAFSDVLARVLGRGGRGVAEQTLPSVAVARPLSDSASPVVPPRSDSASPVVPPRSDSASSVASPRSDSASPVVPPRSDSASSVAVARPQLEFLAETPSAAVASPRSDSASPLDVGNSPRARSLLFRREGGDA